MFNYFKIFLLIFVTVLPHSVYADKINNIEILGNNRISEETIMMFADIVNGDEVDDQKLNKILKNLYKFKFFENVTVQYTQDIVNKCYRTSYYPKYYLRWN